MKNASNLVFALTLVAALGSGLIGGVFFAFSAAVMRALGRLPPGDGIAAMQSINIAIINPVFLGVFLGTGLVCAGLALLSLLRWDQGSGFLIAGTALYLFGSLLVTMALNVPLNNALATVEPESVDCAQIWGNYLSDWTFWNHVRTAASLGAAALLTIALVKNGG